MSHTHTHRLLEHLRWGDISSTPRGLEKEKDTAAEPALADLP